MTRDPSGDSAMNSEVNSDFRDAKSPAAGGINRFDGRCAMMIGKTHSRRDLQSAAPSHLPGWSSDEQGLGGSSA